MPNEKYRERRKGTAADILAGDASTFTNEVHLDRSLLVSKRLCTRPMEIIKFGKTKDTWFTVWNNNIIKPWNGEEKPVIAMQRYLDECFNSESQAAVIDAFDCRSFTFTNSDFDTRLYHINRKVKQLIEEYNIDEVYLEDI